MTVGLDLFVAMTPDLTVAGRPRIARDGKSVLPECLSVGPRHADLVALEQALRMREAGQASRVTCIAAGSAAANETLAHALALGADRAIRVPTADEFYADARVLGHLIADAITNQGGRLVFTGAGSVDGDGDVLPHMIAHDLGAACLTNIAVLDVSGADIRAERRIEKGHRQIWGARLPAVVAFDPGANSPRYAPVAALVLARRAAVSVLDTRDRNGDPREPRPATLLRKLVPPRIRPKHIATGSSSQSAAERMRATVSGGVGTAKTGSALSGSPEQVADSIVAFLGQRGLLGDASG